MNQYYVYILASQKNGTLYIGVTDDSGRRIVEHNSGIGAEWFRQHGKGAIVHTEEYPNAP